MERKELENKIKEINKWLYETTTAHVLLCGNRDDNIKTIHDQLVHLIDSGEAYESFAVFHMVNGDSIKVRNHCIERYCNKYFRGCDICVENGVVYINYYDYDKQFHSFSFNTESICWIDQYSVDIDWMAIEPYIISKILI